MSEEEALSRLKIIEYMFIGDYPRSSYLFKDTFEVAKQALEKQIPKLPMMNSLHTLSCPTCGRILGWHPYDYCEICGQRIGRSDSE